ncbi:sensor domain-containing protein [Hoeflea prorocentri]|uniref:PAS-domain containing protein n=1 Tax=Hoeflea prorocentri TaxID=1922333 RepID=A0A9X3UM64_9HYPH|nr:PAS-domain containing protein [Hoeflea prorocentri]MCY6383096.1 PAS-domain containing protein [Hoeflea prorocentri]MDA5400896.1 PAS-domain containing protein [Hoeflea prorocentri]
MDSPLECQLTDIVESIPAGFLMCDAQERIVACNSLYKKWFFPGMEDIVVLGMTFEELLRLFAAKSPSATDRMDADWIERRLAKRRRSDGPFEHRLADGRVLRTSEKRNEDGSTISIHVDMTELYGQKEAADRTSKQLQVILKSIDQGISMFDKDLDVVAFNPRFLELLDFPPELGDAATKFDDFIRYNAERGEYGDGDSDQQVRERVDLAKQFQPHLFERVRPDGSVVEIRGTPAPGGGMVTTYTDVTEHRRYEEALLKRDQELTEQNERFNAALDNMSQGLCLFDRNRRLLVCNRRYIELYDLPEELVKPGALFDDIVRFREQRGDQECSDPQSYLDEWKEIIESGEPGMKIQTLIGDRTIAVNHQPMPNGGWVSTHEDTTEIQRIQARLAHMAHHDSLTNLPNRTFLRERVEMAIPGIGRGQNFSIMCLDLDRFKHVNDTIGHPMGDKLLKAVADRLRNCVRETDTIARLGGDEFAILQISNDQPKAAKLTAQRICEVLAEPFDLDNHQVVIGTSVGIAVAPEDGVDPDQLIKNADMALYRAKNDGRGIYRFFEAEMDARMQIRRNLEIDLRKAFQKDEFELHYQPLVDLETDEITGFEALLRWSHPERGNVSPAEFIPVAEEIGLIVPLGEWVVRRACVDAAGWPTHTKVAVNLSPAQFRNDELVNTVFNALATSRIAPQRLELEITEHVLLQHNETTLAKLHALRDMGVRIAMDDFGTGYSSLSYLRSFPFDKIKIDRSFIKDLSNQEEADVIVKAVAGLSQDLGITATAEGVETENQREHVKAAGYSEMQGFLISPARPIDEINAEYFPQPTAGKKRRLA